MKTFLEKFSADAPEYLLRHFTHERHAADFIKGNFRLGYYKSYASLKRKDIRQNEDEGVFRGVVVRPGGRASSMSYGAVWPMYILCTFSPSSPLEIREPHGEYVIKINQPKEFHERLSKHLSASLRGSFVGPMVYTNKIELDVDEFNPPMEFHIYSDSLEHSEKQEFRFTYCLKPEHLWPGAEIRSNKFQLPIPPYLEVIGADIGDLCEFL